MPGTLVRDSLAPLLSAGVTLNAAGTTSGTVLEVNKPGDVRIFAAYSTVTGTTPTADIEIKGADDLAFSVNVVSHGRFATSTGGSQSNTTRVIDIRSDKRFMRATVILGGTTPVYTGLTLTAREGDDRRVPLTDTA